MKNRGTQKITTERFILRRFTVNDAEDMFHNWANDPEVTKYLRWPEHQNIEITKKILDEWVANYDDSTYYSWAITLKENDMVIGSIGIMNVREVDECGEIGYCISKSWWGKGIMTEVLKAVISYGFHETGFNRLEADHSINNPVSGRVMQKAGMVYEGIARQKYRANLGFQDCKLYSILKDDFQE